MNNRSHRADSGRRLCRVGAFGALAVCLFSVWAPVESPAAQTEARTAWPYFRPIGLPAEGEAELVDFVIPPGVFTRARYDLADLRVYDARGRESPYALRVLREEDRTAAIEANVYNQAVAPDGSLELSVDLGPEAIEHNEVEVHVPGTDFRRAGVVEGSLDGQEWRVLARENLIRFRRGDEVLEDLRITYPPSRFRYLRLHIHQDPAVDKEPVESQGVTVRHRVVVPGEDLTLPASVGPREPVREEGAPASAWLIDLGGENVPVSEIAVDVGEADFARNYVLQTGAPPESWKPFTTVASGVWQRRAGQAVEPMVIRFEEVRASRLRLVVIDYRNPPLNVGAIRFSAAVRQVVLARPQQPGVRLYYGNPEAEAPNYDFARNLPVLLQPAPGRGALGAEQENPDFIPAPLALSERWPWLIYAVLGLVSVALAGVIVSVARKAIAVHDARQRMD